MKTMTRNTSMPNPIRVPRPYEMMPSMPALPPPRSNSARTALRSLRQMIGENARRRGTSGQDAEDHRFGIVGRAILNLDLGGRAHVDDGAGQLERHPGERMVGVEHDLVLGHVGDREDQVRVFAARRALETHPDLEDLGKPAARLDLEDTFVVVAEGILGLEAHFDAVIDLLPFESRLRHRKYVPVAPVQVLQRLLRALDQLAPEVRQFDVERDDRVFCDDHARAGTGPDSAQRSDLTRSSTWAACPR